jgi:hypothetical protein
LSVEAITHAWVPVPLVGSKNRNCMLEVYCWIYDGQPALYLCGEGQEGQVNSGKRDQIMLIMRVSQVCSKGSFSRLNSLGRGQYWVLKKNGWDVDQGFDGIC